MVYDITVLYQRTVCSLTAVFQAGFRLNLQSAAMMASNRKCLLEDQIEQSLLEEHTASDQSSCNDDDDSSATDDLTVVEVLSSECSDSESDDVQCATASSEPTASSATFTWEDMTNYVGQILINMGLKMKPKMKLIVLKCSKCFLMTNWWN